MKSVSRGKGHSATAAAAYRAGLAIDDPTTGVCHDYTRRQGVVSVDMLAPDGVPIWATDPHEVWGRVEANETRKNARVGREVVMALPHELDADARHALAVEVGQWLVDRYGVAAQVAIHSPDKGGDQRNHHAHILITPRQVGADGFGAYAAKVYDDFKGGPAELKSLREAVAERTNGALGRAGVESRVDHRTLAEQKASAAQRGDFKAAATLDRLPTKHEGKATTQARRRGERLPRARRNDRRQQAAARRLEAHEARFQRLKDEAQAQGRLTSYDEQAAHARALLERTSEGGARLRKAYNPTPTRTPSNGQPPQQRRALGEPLTSNSRYSPSDRDSWHAHGLGALPAVRPLNRDSTCRRPDGHAPRPGGVGARAGGLLWQDAPRHHRAGSPLQRLRAQRGSVAPRASGARSRGGPPEGGEKVERLAELRASLAAAASMEKAIAAILAAAAQALARPQALTPWQRSTARGVLETHQGQTEALTAIDRAAEKRKQSRARLRLARADANDTEQATGLGAAALRAVGLTPAQDKEAQAMRDALVRAKRRHGRAKQAHEDAKQAHQQATTAAEKARADFAGAFGIEVPRFDAKPEPPRPGISEHLPTPTRQPVPRPPRLGPR